MHTVIECHSWLFCSFSWWMSTIYTIGFNGKKDNSSAHVHKHNRQSHTDYHCPLIYTILTTALRNVRTLHGTNISEVFNIRPQHAALQSINKTLKRCISQGQWSHEGWTQIQGNTTQYVLILSDNDIWTIHPYKTIQPKPTLLKWTNLNGQVLKFFSSEWCHCSVKNCWTLARETQTICWFLDLGECFNSKTVKVNFTWERVPSHQATNQDWLWNICSCATNAAAKTHKQNK